MKSLQNCQCEAVLQTWDDHFQIAHARRKGYFTILLVYIQDMCDFMRFRGGLEGVTNRIPSAILVMVFMRLLDVLSTGTL